MSHPNRPGAIYYTLNRKHRVLCRLGHYVVQRRVQGPDGRGKWEAMYNATANREHALRCCTACGAGVRFYAAVGRWL